MATCLVPRSKMRLPAADKATVADRGDWAGSRLTLTMVWGLPAAVMLLGPAIESRTASLGLDIHAELDGGRLLGKCAQVRSHALSLHRALLSWHGSGSTGLHNGRAPAR